MHMIEKITKKIRHELKFGNTRYYERISEKILQSIYKKRLRKKVEELPPLVLNTEKPMLTLATVANKRNFYESVAALYSFCFWKRDISIHYHEDGTLGEEEISFLKTKFPGIKVFLRNEQNKKVDEELASRGLSNCRDLRECFFLSIKLFDMILEKKTNYLLHIDSDALFFRKPEQIIAIADAAKLNGCYNADAHNAYTFPAEMMEKYTHKPMLERFNSGLLLHNFDESVFNFIEQIMEGRAGAASSWHLEQTLLAMCASYRGDFLMLPEDYDLGRKRRKKGHNLISEHYVNHTGHDFHKDFINQISPQFLV